MNEIDNQKCGAFIAQMRKEKGVTQKELAENLSISDKAVSKWERGLSMPDIALLAPLSAQLGITITELLRGEKIQQESQMDVKEVEELVSDTIELSAKERQVEHQNHKHRGMIYLICLCGVLLEVFLLYQLGYTKEVIVQSLGVVEGVALLFGTWMCFFIRDSLPPYYDKYKISGYSNGIFRMNLPGVSFNNRNWPHIMKAGRIWMMILAVGYPILFLAGTKLLSHQMWAKAQPVCTLVSCLGFVVIMMIAGRKYQ